MSRRKTDGERIADLMFPSRLSRAVVVPSELADAIDRIIRRRMAEAWDEGRTRGIHALYGEPPINPYRGRKRKA